MTTIYIGNERRIDKIKWPVGVQVVVFTNDFDRNIDHIKFPNNLMKIVFGTNFNQDITKIKWPEMIQSIEFGHDFNQPIDQVNWPQNLQILDLGIKFNQSINNCKWSKELHTLIFGSDFNQSIDSVQWPPKLHILTFGYEFNKPIDQVNFPETLQELSFGTKFNQAIDHVTWPQSLKLLTFKSLLKQSINKIKWPINCVVYMNNILIYDRSNLVNKLVHLIKKRKKRIANNTKNIRITKPNSWTQWQQLCYKSSNEFNQYDLLALQTYAKTLQISNYNQLTARQLCSQLALNLEQFHNPSKWNQECKNEDTLEGIEFNTFNQNEVIQDDHGYCFIYSELYHLLNAFPRHPYTNIPWENVKIKGQSIKNVIKTHSNPQKSIHQMISTHI